MNAMHQCYAFCKQDGSIKSTMHTEHCLIERPHQSALGSGFAEATTIFIIFFLHIFFIVDMWF